MSSLWEKNKTVGVGIVNNKPRTKDCVTQPIPSLVFGQSTHDARAVTTVNKGPVQRKHTNWTG